LARRAVAENTDIPLIAETGGQNAMIVDSSALPEQVVQDAISSAFDSAGQRCSALRVLFLQEDIADKTIKMLKGAMLELKVGNPDRLATDIGPVIDAEAQHKLLDHIDRMKQTAVSHFALELPLNVAGTFVPPTVMEIRSLSELKQEVFGPVLHVIRYRRADLARLVEQINASGYGLTLGIHSRIDETIEFISARAHVGNIYVNRNIVGAVVGVQPFGGEGKSGTGPKAGGPLYLKRLQRGAASVAQHGHQGSAGLDGLALWARMHGQERLASLTEQYSRTTMLGSTTVLPGPTGERNTLSFVGRGAIVCAATTAACLLNQVAAILATGNIALMSTETACLLPADLPADVMECIRTVASLEQLDDEFQVALVESSLVNALRPQLAARDGALVALIDSNEDGAIPLWRLLAERALCVNTTAAGGNASLMTLEA
ncbi:MAG TPA: aldehyde dehydrogenase family protein, partial [Telluria sp.]|nr:aldehyde dehydrogenase family protein [Telluria sp.]